MFTLHDVEHQRLKIQVDLLQQLVLKLFVMQALQKAEGDKEWARDFVRKLVDKSANPINEFPRFTELTDAEQAMFHDEHAEVFEELKRHLELMLQGAL